MGDNPKAPEVRFVSSAQSSIEAEGTSHSLLSALCDGMLKKQKAYQKQNPFPMITNVSRGSVGEHPCIALVVLSVVPESMSSDLAALVSQRVRETIDQALKELKPRS